MQAITGGRLSGIVTQSRPLLGIYERTGQAPEDYSQPKPVAPKPSAEKVSQPEVNLIEALIHSTVYREYVDAFTEMTGLPLALRPVESWQLPLHGKRRESPFCDLMSEKSGSCASCLQLQEKLTQAAASEPRTMVCLAGLCETAVPVRLGSRLIGFLQTGQVFRHEPTAVQIKRTAKLLAKLGVEVKLDRLKDAYVATRVMPQKQQAAATTLLKIFAQHLSMLSNQIIVQQQYAEPPMIAKAKAYIQEHQVEKVGLGEVAKAISMNKFYFCKQFKKVTGIHFTDYLTRIRIEKCKNLLLNPNLRVSEIAFAAGFQSLTNFNHVFKKLLGQSPTDYRSNLRCPGR